MSAPDPSRPAAPFVPEPGEGFSLERKDSLYRLTPDASAGSWDLFQVSREFDSPAGDFTATLMERLNDWAAGQSKFNALALKPFGGKARVPREILLLDGSPNRLPLSAETGRIAEAFLTSRGLRVPFHVINKREELMARVARAPRRTLVISQSAQRSLYDARLSEALVEMGAIVVPGPLTAPDGPLSNKEKTYEFLNGGSTGGKSDPDFVTARYQAVSVESQVAHVTADAILDSASQMREKWGKTTFFVKPRQGGGGIGCFRIDIFPDGFALPDLSRLGIAPERPTPLPLSLDPDNPAHIRALSWLAARFQLSPATARAYLHDGVAAPGETGADEPGHIAKLLRNSAAALQENLRLSAEPRSRARERLTRAIENYQQLFARPYLPLICNWIDFGLFSVRVHLRIGRSGPRVESLYARLFPVEFTGHTIGTIGVDSIANQEGEGMEFNRYAPLIPELADLAGGADALCEQLKKTFYAFNRFLSFLPPGERERMPVRAEFDISPMSGLIPEGNADPVRGHCANSRWPSFCANTGEWVEDALAYYSWKSRPE